MIQDQLVLFICFVHNLCDYI